MNYYIKNSEHCSGCSEVKSSNVEIDNFDAIEIFSDFKPHRTLIENAFEGVKLESYKFIIRDEISGKDLEISDKDYIVNFDGDEKTISLELPIDTLPSDILALRIIVIVYLNDLKKTRLHHHYSFTFIKSPNTAFQDEKI